MHDVLLICNKEFIRVNGMGSSENFICKKQNLCPCQSFPFLLVNIYILYSIFTFAVVLRSVFSSKISNWKKQNVSVPACNFNITTFFENKTQNVKLSFASFTFRIFFISERKTVFCSSFTFTQNVFSLQNFKLKKQNVKPFFATGLRSMRT